MGFIKPPLALHVSAAERGPRVFSCSPNSGPCAGPLPQRHILADAAKSKLRGNLWEAAQGLVPREPHVRGEPLPGSEYSGQPPTPCRWRPTTGPARVAI